MPTTHLRDEQAVRAEVGQIQNALQQGRGILRERRGNPPPPSASTARDLTAILELGVLMSDVQTCRTRLEAHLGDLAADKKSELYGEVSHLRDQSMDLEKEVWTEASLCLENAACKLVDETRRHALKQIDPGAGKETA